jgi:hypothetical protein
MQSVFAGQKRHFVEDRRTGATEGYGFKTGVSRRSEAHSGSWSNTCVRPRTASVSTSTSIYRRGCTGSAGQNLPARSEPGLNSAPRRMDPTPKVRPLPSTYEALQGVRPMPCLRYT